MGWNPFKRRQKSVSDLINAGQYRQAMNQLKDRLAERKKRQGPPDDQLAALYIQIADTHQSLKETRDAVTFYCMAADYFSDKGFYNKAVAVYKKALSIDPENPVLLDKVAEYNRRVPKFMVDTLSAQEMRKKAKEIKAAIEAHEGKNQGGTSS